MPSAVAKVADPQICARDRLTARRVIVQTVWSAAANPKFAHSPHGVVVNVTSLDMVVKAVGTLAPLTEHARIQDRVNITSLRVGVGTVPPLALSSKTARLRCLQPPKAFFLALTGSFLNQILRDGPETRWQTVRHALFIIRAGNGARSAVPHVRVGRRHLKRWRWHVLDQWVILRRMLQSL